VFRDELVSTLAAWLRNTRLSTNSPEHKMVDSSKTSEETWSAINSEQILDRSVIIGLKEISGPELLSSLLDVFFQDAKNLIEELRAAASAGDITLLSNASHTLKGSSASMGANRLFVLSRHINDLARKGEWPDHVNWVGITEQTCLQTLEEMELIKKLEA
jgi:two-component system, CAI-1 autoinducer sensor kinase/phosphatase CqsS